MCNCPLRSTQLKYNRFELDTKLLISDLFHFGFSKNIEPGTGSQRLVVDQQRSFLRKSPRVIFVEAAKSLLCRLTTQNHGVTRAQNLKYNSILKLTEYTVSSLSCSKTFQAIVFHPSYYSNVEVSIRLCSRLLRKSKMKEVRN